MKLRTLFTLIAALSVTCLANITGKLDLTGAGLLKATSVQVAFQSVNYPVAADGGYSIVTPNTGIKTRTNQAEIVLTGSYDLNGRKIGLNSNQSWGGKLTSVKEYARMPIVAARTMAISDTLYIVVNGDTLREVPLTSWDTLLPPNYVVQRNVGVTVGSSFTSNLVQVVWWNNDSIAHVLDLGHASTDISKFSGYIYTIYSDADFRVDAHLYNLFVRTRTIDSIKSYTQILNVKARVGDLTFSPSDFYVNSYHTVAGYSLTPNDSSVSNYNATKTITMEYVSDTLDTLVTFDSTSFAKFTRDTSHNDSGCRGIKCDGTNPGSIKMWKNATIVPEFHLENDTQVVMNLVSSKVMAIANNVDTINVKHYSYPTWITDATISAVSGDTLTFNMNTTFDSGILMIDNGWVSEVKLIQKWAIIKRYWK